MRFTKAKRARFPKSRQVSKSEINSKSCRVALKFDRQLRSDTAETPVEFRSHLKILNTNLVASRLDEIWESERALL